MKVLAIVATLMLAVLSGRELPAQSLRGLGTLGPDATGSTYSFPTGISADGITVVGESSSGQGARAFRWTKAGGIQGLGTLGAGGNGITFSRAAAVAADGLTVAGQSSSASGDEAFRWTQQSGLIGIGKLHTGPGSYSYATGISADGGTIVGDSSNGSFYDAFVWSADTGEMVRLGTPDGAEYSYSRAAAISSDGMTVVGERTVGPRTMAVVWQKSGDSWSMLDLGTLPADDAQPSDSRAIGVSADGLVVVGQNVHGPGVEAFVWYAETDQLIGLGTLGVSSDATAISSDGTTVVGEGSDGSSSQAFRWTAGSGLTALGSLGGDSRATGVSADGKVIAGYSALSATGTEAFLWTAESGLVGLGTRGYASFHYSVANGISADGTTAFGHSLNKAGIDEAFVTDPAGSIDVAIDVDPKSPKNKFSIKGKGKLYVAILTTLDFDASTVDIETILFGDPLLTDSVGATGAWVSPIGFELVDVDRDGDRDLQLQFDIQQLVSNGAIDSNSAMMVLQGEMLDGTFLSGSDTVTVTPPPKK